VFTFTGLLGNANIPQMTVAGTTGLTPLVTTLVDGIGNEVQTFPANGLHSILQWSEWYRSIGQCHCRDGS